MCDEDASDPVATVSPVLSGAGCADGSDPSSEVDPVGIDVDGSSGGVGEVTFDVAVDEVVAPVEGTACDGGIGIGCC